ncbi:hypothetical protein L7F22_021024 [Adiantum nelumboides]|nr:hypothetical protein [Adiantum nelumboides]
MGNCGLGGHARFKQVVKLVHSNGLIEEFHRPLKAGELLIDYPDHFICHADGLSQLLLGSFNGLLAIQLSKDDDMDVGQIYFLLPKRMLDKIPSRADIAALISKASMARKASYKDSHFSSLPLPARRRSYDDDDDDEDEDEDEDEEEEEEEKDDNNGKEEEERGRAMSREFVRRVLAEAKLQLEKRSATNPLLGNSNPELQSAYTSHMIAKSCAHLWRPHLDTIYEEAGSIAAS